MYNNVRFKIFQKFCVHLPTTFLPPGSIYSISLVAVVEVLKYGTCLQNVES